MIMAKKAFLEITNACNLSCSFCHGTKRKIRYITVSEFERAAVQLRSFADYLYFHVMGEPLLHPELAVFFEIAHRIGFKVILTTNGTLLSDKADILLGAKSLHKVSISLHSFEANTGSCSSELHHIEHERFKQYLTDCFSFCEEAAGHGIISVMRLWNIGGQNDQNPYIIRKMHEFFDAAAETEWKQIYSGYKIKDKIFLEWGEKFDWPDVEADYLGDDHSCYGLRDQVGVLSDGTVVPCCLDADGAIPLGNIFLTPFEEIFASPRATALRKSFETRCITEALCRRCGYAHVKRR